MVGSIRHPTGDGIPHTKTGKARSELVPLRGRRGALTAPPEVVGGASADTLDPRHPNRLAAKHPVRAAPPITREARGDHTVGDRHWRPDAVVAGRSCVGRWEPAIDERTPARPTGNGLRPILSHGHVLPSGTADVASRARDERSANEPVGPCEAPGGHLTGGRANPCRLANS